LELADSTVGTRRDEQCVKLLVHSRQSPIAFRRILEALPPPWQKAGLPRLA
jgi:hypothetical protein